jgi:phosphoribosylformylglycinamidine cyclo-ligase
MIKTTWNTPFVSVKGDIFPVIKRKFSSPEIDHTDGIGTKGFYHWQQRSFKNAALDALAMNLNDLALFRAIPFKLQNHIMIPEYDQEAVLKIVGALVQECRRRKIAITGGDTSIQDNLNGLDISMTVSGFVKTPKPNRFMVGDALIGIKSSGLHSNGFTKIREVYDEDFYPEFITPTRIYLDDILSIIKKFNIHGMMNITGGAFTKFKDMLVDSNAIIKNNHTLKPQKVFRDLYEEGLSDKEIYETFNCGIGFILSVAKKDTFYILHKLKNSDVIGEIVPGKGMVKIDSMFSDEKIEF